MSTESISGPSGTSLLDVTLGSLNTLHVSNKSAYRPSESYLINHGYIRTLNDMTAKLPPQRPNIFNSLPVIASVLGFVVTAGVTYGVLGSTVQNNTKDIMKLQKAQEIIIEIRTHQAAARVERKNMSKVIDRILIILESRR